MRMTPNFAAWTLDPAEFDGCSTPEDRAAFLVRFAVLAPSSHNSQPWRFEVAADGVVVSPDMARALPQSDGDHRQLYLSVGCSLENFLAAAEYYGFSPSVAYSREGGVTLARVALAGQPSSPESRPTDHRALKIAERRTVRGKYESSLPDAAFLEWMRSLAVPEMRLDIIADEPRKTRVAEVVCDALIEAMDDVGFRQELSHYVRPNITRASTGMPMYGFGMPTPPSFIAPALLRRFNVNRLSRKADEALLKSHTPMFAVISTRGDGPKDWLEVGRTYERIALEAERLGMKTAPLAAAIQIGEYHVRLRKLLGTDLRPQMFFRVGFCAVSPPHSPRIGAEDVTHIKR